MILEIDPEENETRYRYNDAGLPIEITDALGGIKTLTWTKDGQILSHTDCSGYTSRWQYDDRGRLQTQTDAEGNIHTIAMTHGAIPKLWSKQTVRGNPICMMRKADCLSIPIRSSKALTILMTKVAVSLSVPMHLDNKSNTATTSAAA